ncbi:Positive regulator of mannosylphosphate transferase, putative, partial [Candida maltosa Xu316]
KKFNYFDDLILKVYDFNYLNDHKLNYLRNNDPEKFFNLKINSLIQQKQQHDLENKFWLIDTTIKKDVDTQLTIPDYYLSYSASASSEDSKPVISSFDPRFTLGLYYNYINTQLSQSKGKKDDLVEVPFNWYDWVDMSVLDKYLIASKNEKPDCSFLDAREDARKIETKNKKIQKLADQWEADKKKAEEDKKKAEEEKQKEEEEKKKQKEDEEKKKEDEEKKKEEDSKKSEEDSKKQEEEKNKSVEDEEKKKQDDKLKEEQDKKKAEEEAKLKEEEFKKSEQQQKRSLELSANIKPEDEKIDMAKVFEDAYQKISEEERKKLEEDVENAVKRVPDPNSWCLSNDQLPIDNNDKQIVHPGFNVFKNPGRTTEQKAIIAGKSFLYSFAAVPSSILFLTAEGSYQVNVKHDAPLLRNNIPETFIHNKQDMKLNTLDEFHSLKKNHKPDTANVIEDYLLHIPKESFVFNGDAMILNYEKRIEKGDELTTKELKYLDSLRYSADKVAHGGPPKYFAESRLIGTTHGDHYDWRFFNGLMGGTIEQSLTLHRLIRAWLSFTRKTGVTTWIAHGSLLSWYWNGIAFPWDNDIDVQVPVMDLHKLSLNYNQTLIVEDPEDGFGRYFLDCGSFITLREKGNGNNNIDARFVDVDTGLYIDITGLALSNSKTPGDYERDLPKSFVKDEQNPRVANEILQIYNCRNNHFTAYDELSPLIKSSVEGEIGYIPSKFSNILSKEYRDGMKSYSFSGYIFVPKIRLWVKEEDLYYFLHNKNQWQQYHMMNSMIGEDPDTRVKDFSYALTDDEFEKLQYTHDNPYKKIDRPLKLTESEKRRVKSFSESELLEFLSNDELLMDYYSTRKFTLFHEQEIMQLTFGKSTAKLMSSSVDLPPLKFEPYLYRLHIDS